MDTRNLRPDAAYKGILKQTSVQMPPNVWEYLDELVKKAKKDPRCRFKGKIGRGDIISGLALAAQLNGKGISAPVELIACGIHWDEDGDCLACGGTGYPPGRHVDIDCPLCRGAG